MAALCVVCHKSKVQNYFLIKCVSCARSWHHRCHSPPISDPDLIVIIRAFNDARARNSDAVINWTCRACRKPKVPIPRTASTKDNLIVIDPDDDVLEIIQPPVKRQESAKPTVSATPRPHSKKLASAKAAQPVRIIDDPIDFLWSAQPSSSSTNTLSSGIGHFSVSDNKGAKEPKHDHHPEPSQSCNPELHSRPASAPSRESTESQETTFSSSTARSRSASRNQPSSPTTPTRSGPSSLNNQPGSLEWSINPGTNGLSFLERWSMATFPQTVNVLDPSSSRAVAQKPLLFHPALLPHHVNSQYRSNTSEGESAKKSDAWYFFAFGKSKAKRAGSLSGPSSSAGENAASGPSQSVRSRKRRAVHYHPNDRPPNVEAHAASKVPFYFNVTAWMKEKEDALTLFEANL